MLCPKCKKGIPGGSRFCLECGSAVSSDSQAEAAQATARAALSLGAGPTLAGAAPATVGTDASLGDQNTLQGTSSPAATPPSAGSGVSLTERYELEAEIGRGGFAVVWKARDRRLGRTVAVKRLLPEAAQGAGAVQTAQRFEREAQAIAALNHRNIVQVFDSDADADGRYIVMEYVAGGTLRDYLKKRSKLPVAEAVALTIGLCRGLAAAHRQGLVHRDVKPANVLLDLGDPAGPVPRLVDFGLARQGRESDVSATGYGLGTPYYMAPEQRRDAKSVTHTADIYALGKTLYEMVTGEVPDSVDPALVPPPDELGRIILKCIRSNPAERYFSAEDLLRDLEVLGTAGAVPVAGAVAAGGSQCPACTRRNPTDAKFCEACGTGLTRRCPECDRENALGLRFCGGCGSDVPVFLQARDALARMQSFAKELKWSRVTKEHGLLTKEVSLPGEKGRKLLADLREVAQAAVVAGRTLVETRQALTHAVAARKFEEAGILCRQITELDPTDVAIAAREAEWAPELQAAKAAVDAGRQALAEQDYRTAKAKADEALALCADLPAAAELRQQCEVGLDGLRQLVSDARARVGAVRELTQAGRLTDARTALASLLAQYENVEVPEDAEVAPDWIEVSAMLAAVEGELAAREREALQRQAARRRRRKQALVAIAITLMGGLGWYLAATTVRHRAMAREQLVTAERHAAFVATARRAASAGDWTTAEQEVAKALALDAKGTETLALAAELEPTLTVTAELDGHEVAGAQIAINGATQQQTTPASYKLERGKTYAFSVSLLPKDGRFYTIAETGVTADWRGPKSWSAKVGVGHGPAEGQAWTVPELGMELLWVAPGGFQMGSADGDDDEKPVHSVRLARGFWLAKHEVIQAEYEQVMGKNPSKSKDVRNPVEFVSWNDAAVFCGKLTAREHTAGRLPPGYEYRLPTEAEWEYAARGGPASKGYTYAGSNSADEVAWYDGNSSKATHPVGQKKPNELGLYDMSGNVWELCLDGYGEFPSGTVTDPVGPANEWALLVARGGALNSGVARCRVAVRSLGVPGLLENFDMGFRACLAHVIAPK